MNFTITAFIDKVSCFLLFVKQNCQFLSMNNESSKLEGINYLHQIYLKDIEKARFKLQNL